MNKYNVIDGENLDDLVGKEIRIDYDMCFQIEDVLTSIEIGKAAREPIFCFGEAKFSLPGDWLWRSGRLREWPATQVRPEIFRLRLYGYEGLRFYPGIDYHQSGSTVVIDGQKVKISTIIEIEAIE